jgi:hypothetical protein
MAVLGDSPNRVRRRCCFHFGPCFMAQLKYPPVMSERAMSRVTVVLLRRTGQLWLRLL